MNEPQMTKEQEAMLDKALEYAQLAEQQARELSEWADAFAAKWERRLREENAVLTPKTDINLEGQ